MEENSFSYTKQPAVDGESKYTRCVWNQFLYTKCTANSNL